MVEDYHCLILKASDKCYKLTFECMESPIHIQVFNARTESMFNEKNAAHCSHPASCKVPTTTEELGMASKWEANSLLSKQDHKAESIHGNQPVRLPSSSCTSFV